jgi:hypothetical protein
LCYACLLTFVTRDYFILMNEQSGNTLVIIYIS